MVNDNKDDSLSYSVKFLIVEDDVSTARVAQALCEAFGCEVQVAHNGVDALRCYERSHADMVLLDLQLPEMGGYETAFELRELEEALQRPPLCIVAVTGTATKEAYLRCITNGMNECLAKPYTSEMIARLLERYCGEESVGATPQEGAVLPRSTGTSI